jgi:hypothetical protein
MVDLGKVIFLGCIHANIWALDTQEGAWAKKVGLASLKNSTRLTSMNLW